jgi:hypothetical protein
MRRLSATITAKGSQPGAPTAKEVHMDHGHYTPHSAVNTTPPHVGRCGGKMMANGLPVAAHARKEVL